MIRRAAATLARRPGVVFLSAFALIVAGELLWALAKAAT